MGQMTKQNIEKAIRDYLMQHLELIPQVRTMGLSDIKLFPRLSNNFSYTGAQDYDFAGDGEGWVMTEPNGKNNRRFKIQLASAHVSGDTEPIIQIDNPVFIEILP